MIGGFTWSWNWGSFGLIKDNFKWGSGYNGNVIFSAKAPTFPFIYLKMNPAKWLEFNYIHGWLNSEVLDSLRTYSFNNGSRQVMHPKYLAANFLSIKPCKPFLISIGNSIVYSDINIYPGYLIPVFFYKSIDHGIANSNLAGQNAQLYFDVNYFPIKKTKLYFSMFIDEIAFDRMFDKAKHSNFYSFKTGFKISNIASNFSLIVEYTRTNPVTYKHFIPTLTFQSNQFNIGYYLPDNSKDLFIKLVYQPLAKFKIGIDFLHAQVGTQYEYTGGSSIWGKPFLDKIIWKNTSATVSAKYELINDLYFYLSFTNSKITGAEKNTFTPQILQGNYFNSSVSYQF